MSIVLNLVAKVLATPKVCSWLIRRAVKTPYSHIGSKEDVYMYRYWLFNPYNTDYDTYSISPHKWFPWNIRIHHIMRPDQDRDLHDHPWNAKTFILEGWYVEERFVNKDINDLKYDIERRAGGTASLKYGEYHRIKEISDGGVWTLFISGKYQGTWGFWVNGAKVQWRKYLGLEK